MICGFVFRFIECVVMVFWRERTWVRGVGWDNEEMSFR